MSKILSEMAQSDDAVHVVRLKDAEPLLKDGSLRRVNMQPEPKEGKVAVFLTIKGRAKAQTKQSEPEPNKE